MKEFPTEQLPEFFETGEDFKKFVLTHFPNSHVEHLGVVCENSSDQWTACIAQEDDDVIRHATYFGDDVQGASWFDSDYNEFNYDSEWSD